MNKPTILVTNDDGIFAPGIRHLVSLVKQIGTPVVVAPDSPQSGQGHAITIEHPLRLRKVEAFDGVESYECSGTPVDCVKLARNVVFKDRKIDLCVSGINHGSNASINILYSGTMSAAMEASLEGLPAIGFSFLNHTFDADFSQSQDFVLQIIKDVLANHAETNILLNVNIPDIPKDQIKGVKVCRQGKGNWKEDFRESIDPRGLKYYWLTGSFVQQEADKDTDIWALDHGFISVVPSMFDLTDYKRISSLTGLEKISV